MQPLEFLYLCVNGYVVALNRVSGEVVWQWKGHPGMTSNATLTLLPDGERIYVGGAARVHALDARGGTWIWEWKCPHWFTNAGVVTLLREGDKLFTTVSGHAYCLDAASGEQIWANELKGLGSIDSPLATTIYSQALPPGTLAPDAASAAIQTNIYQPIRKAPESTGPR
jgi:outer membrane protein assembly factor BamB